MTRNARIWHTIASHELWTARGDPAHGRGAARGSHLSLELATAGGVPSCTRLGLSRCMLRLNLPQQTTVWYICTPYAEAPRRPSQPRRRAHASKCRSKALPGHDRPELFSVTRHASTASVQTAAAGVPGQPSHTASERHLRSATLVRVPERPPRRTTHPLGLLGTPPLALRRYEVWGTCTHCRV